MRVVFLALALIVPGTTYAQPLNQDDAGSGGDAGDRMEDALTVATGWHEGRLLGLPVLAVLRDPLLDQEDWYQVELAPGVITIRAQTFGGSPVLFELRSPTGDLATWIQPGPEVAETRAYSITGGWWFVRAFQVSASGADYTFEVGSTPGNGFASAGTGYTALRVDLPTGSSLAFDMLVSLATSGAPLRRDIVVVRDGALNYYEALRGTLWFEADGEAITARMSAELRTYGWVWFREDGRVELPGPGVYHIIALSHADEAYVSFIETARSGAAAFAGTSGPLIAARPTDFGARLGLAPPAIGAAVDGSLSLAVEGTLVGQYACGESAIQCDVVLPDGTVRASGTLLDTAPGTWTFRRGASAEEGAFALFAADVTLDP
ncbi:MAG: hypothetical protein WDA16_10940 [Candidatus Thermoplasmatota archaeon]